MIRFPLHLSPDPYSLNMKRKFWLIELAVILSLETIAKFLTELKQTFTKFNLFKPLLAHSFNLILFYIFHLKYEKKFFLQYQISKLSIRNNGQVEKVGSFWPNQTLSKKSELKKRKKMRFLLCFLNSPRRVPSAWNPRRWKRNEKKDLVRNKTQNQSRNCKESCLPLSEKDILK